MMFLLDTHALIWFVESNNLLPNKIKVLIEDENNEILISIASLWEIAIKSSLGKLELSYDIETLINNLKANGFEILMILPEHIITLSTLEQIHRDPFDRIIISQGKFMDIPILSSDEVFTEYSIQRIWK